MKLHRVLVTGDREWTDETLVFDVLDELRERHGHLLVIHGRAPGADTCAGRWADSRREACASFPAQWDEQHRAAGPIRNRQMHAEMNPDEALAFHGNLAASKGTMDMVTVLRKAGIPVTLYSRRSSVGNTGAEFSM